ncbi:MAG: alanine/ornithine racemase family PLP-dependent enzyme [Crocinitomicaceae bacterium]
MAYLELYKDKLHHNYKVIKQMLDKHGKELAVVSKLLCGNRLYIQELINMGVKEICDSRISNLKVIKELDPDVDTVYIKPPAKRSIKSVVKYADASFNSSYETIKLLSEEAMRQGKLHKVIIMVEMGDLREGVMGEDLLDFYGGVFELKAIKVTGIGTNLNCMSGVLPSQDKLIQLSLYKELIETRFNRKIPWVTGGSSITLPMLRKNQIPKGVNHFRVGETLFFGNNLLSGKPFQNMKQDVIKLFAEIIEIAEKPNVPIGVLAENPSGEMFKVDEEDYGTSSYRAIVDIGLLDIGTEFLIPVNKDIKVIGASSDMLILDLGKSRKKFKVGDTISFRLKYMGALGIFNSNYIEKRLI